MSHSTVLAWGLPWYFELAKKGQLLNFNHNSQISIFKNWVTYIHVYNYPSHEFYNFFENSFKKNDANIDVAYKFAPSNFKKLSPIFFSHFLN